MHSLIILIIGSGITEHAIIKALSRSEHSIKLYAIGNWINPGIEKLAITEIIDISDNQKILEYATTIGTNIVILNSGSDSSNNEQLLKHFNNLHIFCFISGNDKCLNDITLPFQVLHKQDYNLNKLYSIAKEYDHDYVIKTLTGDVQKTCTGNSAQQLCKAHQTCKEIFATNDTILIKKYIGIEFTMHFFIKGNSIIPTLTLQSYSDDKLNEGCASFAMDNSDLESVRKLVTDYISNVNNYNGVLCGTFIKTSTGKIIVKNYHYGFNVPDIVILLELLKTDLVDILITLRDGILSDLDIQWSSDYAIATNIYSKEYPNACTNPNDCFALIPCSQNIIYGQVSQKDYNYQHLGKLLYVVWSRNKTLPATIYRNKALLSLIDLRSQAIHK